MLGKVWSGMIILSFICAIFTGNMNKLCNASIEGTIKAIEIQ